MFTRKAMITGKLYLHITSQQEHNKEYNFHSTSKTQKTIYSKN